MSEISIKHKIRDLKKIELKIRFANTGYTGKKHTAPELVWDKFFDLNMSGKKDARYPLDVLSAMDRDEFKNVVSEYFFVVYYMFYKENGIVNIQLYDPDLLVRMGLPVDADINAVKKRFRELAKKYHPDTGGDSEKFIEMMENYRKIVDQ